MSRYKPALPFTTPARILLATYQKVNGVNKKVFLDGDVIYVSARSYGGTESMVNDKLTITDTMVIETWFRLDITSIDAIRLLDDRSEWEIINVPEDIDRRHQWLRFKVQRRKGNA